MNKIFAIYDNLAETIIGGLHVFKHDAAAVRFFGDLLADPQTLLARHPADHELFCLGEVYESGVINAEVRVVITGAAWLAAQAPSKGTGASEVPSDASGSNLQLSFG
jgi:hypothetical protein